MDDTSTSTTTRTPRDHEAGMMPRAPLSTSDDEALWVFGYGSIVWRVGFEYEEATAPVCARGFRRRFYQGSTDHRGTTEFPGRTATLERCDDGEVCWGAAYKVSAANRAEVLEYLEVREKQYDERIEMDLYDVDDASASPVISNAVTYIATPAEINLNWLGNADDLAEQIAKARGPSGENSEYLYNLCAALRGMDIEDDDLYALEARVRMLRGD
ncbi:ChaC-like protein [Ostreococcus tauri]|uniref:glutathione-specific gamma-glutamylcyclotransferase n=1 Tax=Ostreococcus tauri TaxID=70448 RepID=A0A096P9M7_OSTTA|nr:ChaC-like protein [Ostreococcus tauri]CEG00653.1 ChaC-like protein [Ostreococcus tauri]|eukprot:XP_022840503.1 ChaC-like protein [Ostreococcus tauri]